MSANTPETSGSKLPPEGARWGWMVAAALVVGIATNILWASPLLPGPTPFVSHDSLALEDLTRVEQRTVNLRYTFYADLRRLAHGLTLVAPGELVEDDNVDGIADMALAPDEAPSTSDEADCTPGRGDHSGSVRLEDDVVRDYVITPPSTGDDAMFVTVSDDCVEVRGGGL